MILVCANCGNKVEFEPTELVQKPSDVIMEDCPNCITN